MAMKITVTENDVFNADTYIPIVKKQELIERIAGNCIDRCVIALQDDHNGQTPMPPFYKENTSKKSRYLMGIFARFYLKAKYDPTEDDFLMAADDYDRWAGSHVFKQIDRLRNSEKVRDKIFDILSDYRDFEKKLNTEIYSMLQLQNDPCSRLCAMMFMQTTPEAIKSAMANLEESKKDLDKYLKTRVDNND